MGWSSVLDHSVFNDQGGIWNRRSSSSVDELTVADDCGPLGSFHIVGSGVRPGRSAGIDRPEEFEHLLHPGFGLGFMDQMPNT